MFIIYLLHCLFCTLYLFYVELKGMDLPLSDSDRMLQLNLATNSSLSLFLSSSSRESK